MHRAHRSRPFAFASAALSALLALACGNKDKGPGPSPSATVPSSTPPPLVEAPPSPFSVVLESKSALAFSGLGDGVAVADADRKHLATQLAGAEIEGIPMPGALPESGRILGFAGKLPRSLWLLFEAPAPGKDAPKNPLYRLDLKKDTWKRFAEDWKPHLAPWSKGRILAMSTSSGKLKIKVIEPHHDKPPPDQPGGKLDDEGCAKSLRVDGITALASGEVFAAGHCKPGGGARRYVIVRWSQEEEAKGAADAGAADASAPHAVTPDAGTSDGGDANASAPDAGDADAGAPPEDTGIPGKMILVADAPASVEHRALIAQAPHDAWALASEISGTAHLFRIEGDVAKAEKLPADLDGAARGIAGASDGTLWLVTANGIWKRYPPGEWERVPPPTRQYAEPDPSWEIFDVAASGADVWIAARHKSKQAERHTLLRLRPAKEVVRW